MGSWIVLKCPPPESTPDKCGQPAHYERHPPIRPDNKSGNDRRSNCIAKTRGAVRDALNVAEPAWRIPVSHCLRCRWERRPFAQSFFLLCFVLGFLFACLFCCFCVL